MRFASEPSDGRFDEVPWDATASGNPVITGAAAWVDCRREAVIGAGDHSIILGRARDLHVGTDAPMVFLEGSFGFVTK
jgi:flavin reductase (DIM6/NTAB) family NADH-FMN oxidoreductase RutF